MVGRVAKRAREREKESQKQRATEKETQRESPHYSLAEFFFLPFLFYSGSSLLDGVTHIQGKLSPQPQLMFSGNTLTDTVRSEFY
jgi:hypothetical protein